MTISCIPVVNTFTNKICIKLYLHYNMPIYNVICTFVHFMNITDPIINLVPLLLDITPREIREGC